MLKAKFDLVSSVRLVNCTDISFGRKRTAVLFIFIHLQIIIIFISRDRDPCGPRPRNFIKKFYSKYTIHKCTLLNLQIYFLILQIFDQNGLDRNHR